MLIFKRDTTTGLYKTPLYNQTTPWFQQKRDLKTWDGVIRNSKPETPDKQPLEKQFDPETGYEIMPDPDYSGQNHGLLRNLGYVHPIYSKIHGAFTSSTKPIDGIIPEMIDSHLFTGAAKPQFFVRFLKPKLIRTASISEDKLIDLSAEHIQEFLQILENVI